MRVEEVLKKVKIEDIVMADVPIRMVRDKGYAVDKTGPWKAVTVYSREQAFYDFKSKEGGNAIKWLQYFHGDSYDDALRVICDKAAVNPDDLFYFQKLATMPVPIPKATPMPVVKVEVAPQPIVMPQAADYPCTIAWPDGSKSYTTEIDLLEDCLRRAPDLAWYCHFLDLAKPYIMERSKKRRELESQPEAAPVPVVKLPEPATKQVELFISGQVGGGHYYE